MEWNQLLAIGDKKKVRQMGRDWRKNCMSEKRGRVNVVERERV